VYAEYKTRDNRVIPSYLKKIKQSSTNAVFTALVMIGTIAMYGWIVAPHVAYLKAVQEYEPILDSVVREKVHLQKLLANRRKILHDWNEKFMEISDLLFTEDQVRELFSALDVIAYKYGCTVSKVDRLSEPPVKVIGEKGDSTVVESQFSSLRMIGPYNGIVDFIQGLQDNKYKIWIKSLEIHPVEPSSGSDQLVCTISIMIYVIIEKEVVLDG